MAHKNTMRISTIKKQGGFRNPRKQSGYIIVVSIILLGAMLVATLQFFEQSKIDVQASGYNRDSAEALLLAESAANMLYGQYVFGEDIAGTNAPDRTEGFNENDLPNLPLSYMYYRGPEPAAGAGQGAGTPNIIANALPSILQMVANGEALRGSRTTVATANHKVPGNAANLIVEELYSNSNGQVIKPVLYEVNANNQLVMNTSSQWQTITGKKKAAAWLELTKNPAMGNTVQIYVQAVGQVGKSKNYVQRLVGVFTNSLGLISATTESK